MLTGSRARVGNYPGVTVEKRAGRDASWRGWGGSQVLDVPGTYSLVSRTGEEQIALAALVGLAGERRPDAVVLCVDATQLVRGLYLVLQALELGLPVVVALTMVDEAGAAAPDAAELARRLGCPVVPVIAPKGQGARASCGRPWPGEIADGPASPRWRWRPGRRWRRRSRGARRRPRWPRRPLAGQRRPGAVGADERRRRGRADRHPASTCALAAQSGAARPATFDDEAIQARYAWLDAQVAPLVAHAARPPAQRPGGSLADPPGGRACSCSCGIMFVLFQSLFAWAEPAITLVEGLFGGAGRRRRAGCCPRGCWRTSSSMA